MPVSRRRRSRRRESNADLIRRTQNRIRLQLVVEASARLHGFPLWDDNLGLTAEQAQGANPEPVHHAGTSAGSPSGCTSDRP